MHHACAPPDFPSFATYLTGNEFSIGSDLNSSDNYLVCFRL